MLCSNRLFADNTMGSLNISTLPWTHPTIFSRYDYVSCALFCCFVVLESTLLTYIGSKSCWQVVYISSILNSNVADPHHFFTLMRIQFWILRFTLMEIRIQLFTLIRILIRILLLIEVIRIGNHWSADPPRLLCEWPRPPHDSILSLHSSCFRSDPAFHSDADLDPYPAS